MAYTSIRTAHSVGDVLFFYDSDQDAVRRVVVCAIEARINTQDIPAKWNVIYSVKAACAAEGGAPYYVAERDLHDRWHDAFPPIPPAAEEPAPELSGEVA